MATENPGTTLIQKLKVQKQRLMETPMVTKLNMAWLYHRSSLYSAHRKGVFDQLKTFCAFIGHARSGHSIMGALLDAHPNIILADEFDTLKYVEEGFSREKIFNLILAKSRKQAMAGRQKTGRGGKYYSYKVPNQWQGTYEDKLQVIGDGKAGRTVRRLTNNLELLESLQTTIDLDIKLIHVIRNPYDNISTMNLRSGMDIDYKISEFFSRCQTINNIREVVDSSNILLVKQEAFIEDPVRWLGKMCHFLGVKEDKEYLDACASILYSSPAKSRSKVKWETSQIEEVQSKISQYDFLSGYSFES